MIGYFGEPLKRYGITLMFHVDSDFDVIKKADSIKVSLNDLSLHRDRRGRPEEKVIFGEIGMEPKGSNNGGKGKFSLNCRYTPTVIWRSSALTTKSLLKRRPVFPIDGGLEKLHTNGLSVHLTFMRTLIKLIYK